MAKIEGIRIKSFRGLKDVSMGRTSENPDAEPLTPMTVVIGKNGVGKSTLFDAFGFLADALKYGVEEACDNRGGFEKICSQGEVEDIEFEITYKVDYSDCSINYRVVIDMDDLKRPFVAQEELSYDTNIFFLNLIHGVGFALKDKSNAGSDIYQTLELLKLLEKMSFEFTTASIVSLEHKKSQLNTDFQAIVLDRLNEAVLQMGIKEIEVVALENSRKLGIATLGALKQHPEIAAFRQFLESWYLSYFTPDAARSLPLDGVHQHLNSRGDNLANVVKYMEREYGDKFQDILDSIAEKIPGIHKISTQKTPDGRLLLCFNDKGFQDPFYAPQMSDGTLKLFAYLLLLADPNPPPFICIEEPENGLYHKLLEVLASEFRRHTSEENKTQLFITTHQPYFVDGLNPREVWILEKGEDGFSTIRRASDDDLVNSMVEEELPLGGLWYSGYLDKRSKPCTLKS